MLTRPDEFAYFSPSPSTIKRCLATRKSDIRIGNAVKPGVIGCDDFGWDSMFFSIAVALEIVGLGAILMNRLPLTYALTGMVLAILLDIVLALWLHALISGKTVLLRAEQAEARAGLGNFVQHTSEQRSAWAAEKEALIRRRRRLAYLPAAGIVLFCLAKIVAYAGLKGFRTDTGLLLVIVSYLVVAYIHLTRTGYWWAAIFAEWAWKKDIQVHQRKHRDGTGFHGLGEAGTQSFALHGEGLRSDKMPKVSHAGEVVHEVVELQPFQKNAQGQTVPGRYELRCRGVLMDDEVRSLLRPVPLDAKEAREAIAMRCLVYQLSLIHTDKEGA